MELHLPSTEKPCENVVFLTFHQKNLPKIKNWNWHDLKKYQEK